MTANLVRPQVLNQLSLNFFPQGSIGNRSALVQLVAWNRPDAKPFPKPMMTWLMQICQRCVKIISSTTYYIDTFSIVTQISSPPFTCAPATPPPPFTCAPATPLPSPPPLHMCTPPPPFTCAPATPTPTHPPPSHVHQPARWTRYGYAQCSTWRMWNRIPIESRQTGQSMLMSSVGVIKSCVGDT